ncbi:MAG: hypothetical protein IJU76_02220 [Desulfovibrionaceae bacterium]|nr:hypothetical protein [Desulfovibrionaceae bacterium]
MAEAKGFGESHAEFVKHFSSQYQPEILNFLRIVREFPRSDTRWTEHIAYAHIPAQHDILGAEKIVAFILVKEKSRNSSDVLKEDFAIHKLAAVLLLFQRTTSLWNSMQITRPHIGLPTLAKGEQAQVYSKPEKNVSIRYLRFQNKEGL